MLLTFSRPPPLPHTLSLTLLPPPLPLVSLTACGFALCPQEFMILPVGASSFKEAMKMGSEVYHHLKVPPRPCLARTHD